MPISLHSHSGQFCKHAFGTLEEAVRRAIELGFTHYGLSEHMPRYESDDLYDEEIELGLVPEDLVDMFEDFVKQARHLQEKYRENICLLVGMETEVIRDDSFDKIKELRERLKLDYLVGSVHHVNGVPTDFSLELFNKAESLAGGTEGVMCKYFDHQYELMKVIKPEVVGHFDVIRLYRPDFEFSESIWKKIVRNINYGISYGALFEINTSGASPRKSLKLPYPSARVLEFLVCSGARLTLSDDAHGPGDVGFWYNNLPGFLGDNHITELYCLERNHTGDGKTLGCSNQVVCKKYDGSLNHPFWVQCQKALKENPL